MMPLQIPLRYFKELQQKQQILFLAKVTVLARHQVLQQVRAWQRNTHTHMHTRIRTHHRRLIQLKMLHLGLQSLLTLAAIFCKTFSKMASDHILLAAIHVGRCDPWLNCCLVSDYFLQIVSTSAKNKVAAVPLKIYFRFISVCVLPSWWAPVTMHGKL